MATLASGAKPIFQTMLMSDLHLEFPNVNPPVFPVVAPILILAGDIGRPDIPTLSKFLLDQCQRFEHIFYVAGNHCFYQGIYEQRLQQLRQLNSLHPRIHFLQQDSYLLPNNVRILGTTLWTHVRPISVATVSQRLNDYRCIGTLNEDKTSARAITVNDTNTWHDEQYAWLLQQIEMARHNREHVVIITHHAPCGRRSDTKATINDAFVNDHHTDCVDPVRLWVYGHTHQSTNFTVNSTRILSNQLGYTHEQCGFRPNMQITLYDDGTVTVADAVI